MYCWSGYECGALTDYSMASPTTITATAIPAPPQADPILAPPRHPRTTLARTTVVALQVTRAMPRLLDSPLARVMGVTARNNILLSHSKDTAMARRLDSVDSLAMGGQRMATAKDHPRVPVVTDSKVRHRHIETGMM